MQIINPRRDFVIVEDFFSLEDYRWWLKWILDKGSDPIRGFHHPHLRPNRFHPRPKYPVKKYMCLGLYWEPMDYTYGPVDKQRGSKPFPIPSVLKQLCQDVLNRYYPFRNYHPETALVNFYTEDSKMGLHRDKDEEDHLAPVIGFNFGSRCRFFYEQESGEMGEVKIPGNSVYIFGQDARLMLHGTGTVYAGTLAPGSDGFLANKERINLTVRQVFSH
jgi:alkylated DNA repair dioxygenase AlkB